MVGNGADTPYAPLHVYAENGRGLNAIFGKGFVDSANYHYDDANIQLNGRDVDGNDTGSGIEFNSRNTGNSNWLHGAITQDRSGNLNFINGGAGTAKGTVVSWTADGNGNGGILKYFQSPKAHTDGGVVRAFENNSSSAIVDGGTSVSVNPDSTYSSTTEGVTFASGLANPEIKNNSGELVYIENRRLITRAADQIEDIKLVIEF